MIKTELVIEKIGMSLIGVGAQRPCSWGNYFWIGKYRCLNFWWENLETANKKFKLGNKVKVRIYEDTYFIVDDDRIPKDWYYNKCCTTGSRSPTVETMKEIFEYLGDPGNELERYTDPKSYWEKRGAEYIPRADGFATIKRTFTDHQPIKYQGVVSESGSVITYREVNG